MVRNKEEIIYYLSNKYDLPIYIVRKIINFQFKFVAKQMKKGDLDSIRLPYFGKFSVNKNRVKHIKRLKSEKIIKKV
jgi:nucleoid DNA-binding protein